MQSQDTVEVPLRARDGPIRAYAIIDAADADWVNQWLWHLCAGYASRAETIGTRKQRTIYLHRELLGLPRIRDGREGDHINRNRLDNRGVNLRIVLKHAQAQNVPSRNGSSSYRGVSWSVRDRVWRAAVTVNGERHYLGSLATEAEAAEAAQRARREFAPFATD